MELSCPAPTANMGVKWRQQPGKRTKPHACQRNSAPTIPTKPRGKPGWKEKQITSYLWGYCNTRHEESQSLIQPLARPRSRVLSNPLQKLQTLVARSRLFWRPSGGFRPPWCPLPEPADVGGCSATDLPADVQAEHDKAAPHPPRAQEFRVRAVFARRGLL